MSGNLVFLGFDQNNCSLNSFTHPWVSRNHRRSGNCCRHSRDLWFKLPFAPRIGHVSQLPPARVTCSRTLLGAWQPWPVRASPTRPWEDIGFEELLSELIARAWMLRPQLGSRLVSTMLTYGVRCRTLSCEERCGSMIANPVKSTCTSTTPQLSERVGADACL